MYDPQRFVGLLDAIRAEARRLWGDDAAVEFEYRVRVGPGAGSPPFVGTCQARITLGGTLAQGGTPIFDRTQTANLIDQGALEATLALLKAAKSASAFKG